MQTQNTTTRQVRVRVRTTVRSREGTGRPESRETQTWEAGTVVTVVSDRMSVWAVEDSDGRRWSVSRSRVEEMG